jgi:hypothetical protein
MRLAETGQYVAETVAEALGRQRRSDPVLPGTGGPAGNAVLTAWTALVLLVGSVAELLTLFDVRGLISWHVAIGALLVPPALLKVGSTGWRMLRYYVGSGPYQKAGPPPMLLRLLGPLVVVSTLGLLGSGVLLVVLGQDRSQQWFVTLPLVSISWVSVHQAFFAVWAVVTGLHVLGRIVPALRLTVGPDGSGDVPGVWSRRLLLVSVVVSAVLLAVVLVHADGSWTVRHEFDDALSA